MATSSTNCTVRIVNQVPNGNILTLVGDPVVTSGVWIIPPMSAILANEMATIEVGSPTGDGSGITLRYQASISGSVYDITLGCPAGGPNQVIVNPSLSFGPLEFNLEGALQVTLTVISE